jgi:hypothetical protein
MDPLLIAHAPAVVSRRVRRVTDRRLLVEGDHGGDWCDVLSTSREPVDYRAGDEVLVCWVAGRERAVVLGRIGGNHPTAPPGEVPESVVIEARTGLTLRCGKASMTMREDGKILIKGTDLVSHAEHLNRIKGGSVAIN